MGKREPFSFSRRKALAAGVSASAALPAAVKNGRIRQSLVFWCLNGTDWKWDIDRICSAAKSLGCRSVELVPPELWPTLRKHALESALAPNGMPDPPFRRGVNNAKYHEEVITRTKQAIDQACDFRIPNVIALPVISGATRKIPAAGLFRPPNVRPIRSEH